VSVFRNAPRGSHHGLAGKPARSREAGYIGAKPPRLSLSALRGGADHTFFASRSLSAATSSTASARSFFSSRFSWRGRTSNTVHRVVPGQHEEGSAAAGSRSPVRRRQGRLTLEKAREGAASPYNPRRDRMARISLEDTFGSNAKFAANDSTDPATSPTCNDRSGARLYKPPAQACIFPLDKISS
jgi:hypothetical protein